MEEPEQPDIPEPAPPAGLLAELASIDDTTLDGFARAEGFGPAEGPHAGEALASEARDTEKKKKKRVPFATKAVVVAAAWVLLTLFFVGRFSGERDAATSARLDQTDTVGGEAGDEGEGEGGGEEAASDDGTLDEGVADAESEAFSSGSGSGGDGGGSSGGGTGASTGGGGSTATTSLTSTTRGGSSTTVTTTKPGGSTTSTSPATTAPGGGGGTTTTAPPSSRTVDVRFATGGEFATTSVTIARNGRISFRNTDVTNSRHDLQRNDTTVKVKVDNGETKEYPLQFTNAGTYTFTCTQPGHFGQLTVTVP